ncbi:MAG: Peptidase T-like protein [Candidatus Nomurabacteria bacterium GW2011_GWB1_37_5]|uniref:Peptidase T-like protein n=1 Tax=Candidatus Nomurabacteria bacterium GW2011_GWB1_37_5 TaxID=1618742 RepID=A0A0G0GVZ0_9BACT|nr:MAG: Peptidase T-like protein [Candidatus Nomurabacteria bacterium GW2011_GWB1_37_5]
MTNKQISDLFIKLAETPSPSGEETLVAKFIKDYLTKLGWKVWQDKSGVKNDSEANNVYAYLEIDKKYDTYVFSAHMDTVEPGKNIKPKIINGVIKSDGTTILGADNKIAIASIINALQQVNPNRRRSLEIVFSVREETDGGIADFDFSKAEKNSELETELMDTIEKAYGVRGVFEMDHNRLPRYVGKIGLEQHLYRYPGDGLSLQGAYLEVGIAPARGAFGYFSEVGKSYEQMVNEEKYYIVLQTSLIPNWNRDWVNLKDWYKFRKFLVVNPENEKAVVGVLGDSGPGVTTGKHFGGSPEMMVELGFYPQATRGTVLVLFLDDPGQTVSLGPVSLKGE